MYDSIAAADCHIPVCENGESVFVELLEYKKCMAEDTKEFKADVLANVAELRNDIDLLFYEQLVFHHVQFLWFCKSAIRFACGCFQI